MDLSLLFHPLKIWPGSGEKWKGEKEGGEGRGREEKGE